MCAARDFQRHNVCTADIFFCRAAFHEIQNMSFVLTKIFTTFPKKNLLFLVGIFLCVFKKIGLGAILNLKA